MHKRKDLHNMRQRWRRNTQIKKKKKKKTHSPVFIEWLLCTRCIEATSSGEKWNKKGSQRQWGRCRKRKGNWQEQTEKDLAVKAEAGKEGTAERGKQGRRNRRVSGTKQNPVPRKSHGAWTEGVSEGHSEWGGGWGATPSRDGEGLSGAPWPSALRRGSRGEAGWSCRALSRTWGAGKSRYFREATWGEARRAGRKTQGECPVYDYLPFAFSSSLLSPFPSRTWG